MTILHGSASRSLKCGGICNDHSVSNFVLRVAVKEFWKSINVSRSYRHGWGVLFLTHTVHEDKQDRTNRMSLWRPCMMI